MNKILTFSCSNNIFVFEEGCGKYPVFPYKVHKSVDDAKEYLKTNGKNHTNIILAKGSTNEHLAFKTR